MTRKFRPRLGAPTDAPSTALTFPAQLIYPPQSQIARSAEVVADRIAQLDNRAQQLGAGFGIAMTTFELNPLPTVAPGDSGWLVAGAVLGALVHQMERVSLERRNGRWGLYFTREPAVVMQGERRSESMFLRDAPLDVRERFLVKSEAFFREYLKLCEDRLGKMSQCVASADQTLAMLENVQLT